MPTARVADHELYYERRGTGEPILLIMGLGATTDYWGEGFLEKLARHFSVVTYDHRGIGRSDRTSADFTVIGLAEDAAGLLRALKIASAHVVGFSLGGMVAQALAARHPEVVRRLVLAGTSAGSRTRPALSIETLSRLSDAMVSADPAQAVQAGLDANVSADSAARPEVREAWINLVSGTRMPLRTIQRQLKAAQAHDGADLLRSITSPALVVHGSEDRLVEPAHADELAAALPDARVALVPGAGHMFFWEKPELSGELIAAWLRGDRAAHPKSVEVHDVVRK
jgi:pimeloyl-ACP methyl ester carboxylesterase